MDSYLIYRRNSYTEYEFLGSARNIEIAIDFAMGVPNSVVITNDNSIFKTIVFENN